MYSHEFLLDAIAIKRLFKNVKFAYSLEMPTNKLTLKNRAKFSNRRFHFFSSKGSFSFFLRTESAAQLFKCLETFEDLNME